MGKTRTLCPPEFKFELKRAPSVAPTKGLADSLISPYFIAVLCTCYNAAPKKFYPYRRAVEILPTRPRHKPFSDLVSSKS